MVWLCQALRGFWQICLLSFCPRRQQSRWLAGWLTDRNKVFFIATFLQWVRGIYISCAHTQCVWRYLGCVVWINSMMWGFWVFSFAFYVIKGKDTGGYSCWHGQKECIWFICIVLVVSFFIYITHTQHFAPFWSKHRTCMLCNAVLSFSKVLVCSSIVPSLAQMQIWLQSNIAGCSDIVPLV